MVLYCIYYVYVLCDPRFDFTSELESGKLPFYVGKGKGPRASKHLSAPAKQSFLRNKIEKIRRCGLEPIVEFYKKDLTQDEAFKLEKELITRFGRIRYDSTGLLVNLSEGGTGGTGGVKFSDETRKRMSLAKQNMSVECKEKISKNHRYNKPCTLKDPNGAILEIKGLTNFCRENNLDYQPLRNSLRYKKPVKSGASVGWTLLSLGE